MSDQGGEPACWAHLFDEARAIGALVANVDTAVQAATGAVWSLPHGGDLDANLVRLAPGAAIAAHRNDDLDVLIIGRSGTATLTIDGVDYPLDGHRIAHIPRGTLRAIVAGVDGAVYFTVHRRRDPLTIGPVRTISHESSWPS